ncbi:MULTISPECIES: preprotein translocase subunit SecY [unclassified Borrelia]|uniref:preprotein translocase subunit SecY n=1 Tax=unclassified Borrelia TaxID=2649934 RepID=UPI001E590740|nr:MULTISPECIES: preprotein translocase subunit SecY [unclassified Borrelia]UGQ16178.1 preprotein translocase subunit SecY [Borrelia sp. RT5S]UGQ17291.1 preprotein translocase subunit SecY [Borrelia sp. RT1S]
MKDLFFNLFSIKELRTKFLFTLSILFIFRVGSYLPIPGINPVALRSYFKAQADFSITNYFDFFSGGAFSNFSVFMLGIGPYISASIIIQLLVYSFPSLKRMQEGDGGRKKVKKYTKYLTIVAALAQGYATSLYARSIPGALNMPFSRYIFIAILTVTAGTFILLWLGEQINQRGIGNGVSLIIFSGIVVRLQAALFNLFQGMRDPSQNINPVFVILVLGVFVVVVVLIIYEYKAQRRIAIHYARASSRGTVSSYLPIKLNPSGVLPVIFASVLITLPLQILSGFAETSALARQFLSYLRPNGLYYNLLNVVLIVGFTYFYSKIQLSPKDISNNIRKNGGTIPGIKADEMEGYLDSIMNRTLFSGSIFLSIIAIIPFLVQTIFRFPYDVSRIVGSSSLLIMVGVALDTLIQIDAYLKTRGVSRGNDKKSAFLQKI